MSACINNPNSNCIMAWSSGYGVMMRIEGGWSMIRGEVDLAIESN